MSHYGKCKHDIYLGGCRKCFPLPESKEKYTFGWHDARGLYGEPKTVEENIVKPNVPLWFRLAVKLFYWLKKASEK
jgi:hypothetical protein